MKMVNADAFPVGKALSANWDMTNAKWLIVVDMANVLMGNVFVPEDTPDTHASKVRKKTITDTHCSFPLGLLWLGLHEPAVYRSSDGRTPIFTGPRTVRAFLIFKGGRVYGRGAY